MALLFEEIAVRVIGDGDAVAKIIHLHGSTGVDVTLLLLRDAGCGAGAAVRIWQPPTQPAKVTSRQCSSS